MLFDLTEMAAEVLGMDLAGLEAAVTPEPKTPRSGEAIPQNASCARFRQTSRPLGRLVMAL